jgi:7-keto-8-aminopelargonate synthetase-like enzyme
MQVSRAKRHEAFYRTVERHIGDAADAGVCRATVCDPLLAGDSITVDGRRLLNFGSCMYMGLNVDPRLKQGAIDAIERFGPVYSSSPVYTSVDLYEALRERLERIFGHPVAIPTTTTLGHLGVLPVLITPDDAVLVDQQAHTSMHMATQVLIASGVDVTMVPHNDLERLEAMVEERHRSHDRIWYLADGVYSMFGDMAPVHDLAALQRRYDNLWLYYDDAHGFGWRGRFGRGYVLDQMELNERMVVAVSLSKSFGTGGAAVVFPDPAMVRRVQVAGGTFVFSGPLHPAELGAAVASADIHLSNEQVDRSLRLRRQIRHIQERMVDMQLPAASLAATPIWFVWTGGHLQSIELVQRLMDDGFYANPSAFPAVPMGKGGVRFTNTLYHDLDQIDALLDSLARHAPGLVGEGIGVRVDLAAAGD